MLPPKLSVEQVKTLVPEASDIQVVDAGGQKSVFSGVIEYKKYALKFMSPDLSADMCNEHLDNVTARARREVETMKQCSVSQLVKMGPIDLASGSIDGQAIIYFSEEFIEGKNLLRYQRENGPFSIKEVVRLAFDVSEAIRAIWRFSKVHRDIKPTNIMRRDADGEFVLLDMGLVLDLQDSSLSISPVGTPVYFSPEQTDFARRRTVMDFRSDLFSLGIVLYQVTTGKHPFVVRSSSTNYDVVRNIISLTPEPPISHRPDMPKILNDIILRLLAKRPSLRYRNMEFFQQDLRRVYSERG